MVYMMATEWKVTFPECCDGTFLHCLGIQRSSPLCEVTDNVGSRESERNDTRRVPFEHVASLRTAFVAQPRIWWR
jgi:hypothetical protein